MKSILISIKPKWCVKIMNGEKTIEIRTSKALANAVQKLIDENGYAEIYGYCTKGNEDIVRESSPYSSVPYYAYVKLDKKLPKDLPEYEYSSSGKVIFKFRCYKVVKYPYISDKYDELIGSCLSEQELIDYATEKFDKELGYRIVKTIYALHISNLTIFNKPKELSEFEHETKTRDTAYGYIYDIKPLTKSPQSWQYIEV